MISVIVPVYGTELYLNQCVESIINQTYRDLEIILIDDGSPDRCGEMCDGFAERDDRVKVIHTENRGISAARNLGIKEAKGEYIGFVDSDDWIEPDMYNVLLAKLTENDADISICGMWYMYTAKKVPSNYVGDAVYKGNEIIQAFVLNKIKVFVTNKLFKKDLFCGLSFPEGRNYEDNALIHRILLNAEVVTSLSKGMYYYRQRANSTVTYRNMSNLADYWNSFYDRYTVLTGIPSVRENKLVMSKLEEQIANSAARTWWWVYKVPRNLRNNEHMKTVSAYVRGNFPVFGKPGWKPYLRISIFLARYANPVSYAIGYFLNSTYRRFRNKGESY